MPGRVRGANLSRADWMLRRLDDEGLRLTGRRQLVVRAIADKPGSFTPEALVDALRPNGIGRATVYRALEVLERIGVLTRVHLGSHAFTVCDESHHHHLLCSSCNAVVAVDASAIESEIQNLAQREGFRIDTHMLEFAGRCAECLARSN
jgi:Fur family ferric uptake transcriptional regulator